MRHLSFILAASASCILMVSCQKETLQEQIDSIKAQQNLLDEEMDKLAEKHIEATAQSEKPYQPKYKPSISVL